MSNNLRNIDFQFNKEHIITNIEALHKKHIEAFSFYDVLISWKNVLDKIKERNTLIIYEPILPGRPVLYRNNKLIIGFSENYISSFNRLNKDYMNLLLSDILSSYFKMSIKIECRVVNDLNELFIFNIP